MKRNYVLLATNTYLYECFTNAFHRFDNVKVHLGIFEQLEQIDCLVSPANSFGLMDGGMDAAITNYFGDQLQKRVQEHIINEYYGEQPIGTSFIVETNNERIKYLAHSPTMRIPKIIKNTDNVYMATKATLIAIDKFKEKIDTVAFPAFGAGCGQVHPVDVAYQMSLAFKHFENPPKTIDWNFARFRDYEILK
ncbi:macro domain-containing protein [Bacillus sp. T33-2]|uniref:macro domain-containing protein n=1 Tax=Bacillus sp. T33-2 TaxID=2054168 RepID=UPI000C778A95|nr:macro domain-containing protein [Bacillus sp. T33-2]PLR99487.1 phage tail protein [Bacillus sp. T33-2]